MSVRRSLTLTAAAVLACGVALAPAASSSASPGQPALTKHASRLGKTSKPVQMKGGKLFQHPKPRGGEHDQSLINKLPVDPKAPPLKQGASTAINSTKGQTVNGRQVPAVVSLQTNTANAVPADNDPVDPSVAASGNVVVYATNEFISFSTDGGATFHSFNPASLYSDNPDGGTCCDQQVVYVPSISRFVWLDQYWGSGGGGSGHNRYRLAVFAPSAVTESGLTSWTYWDITAAMLPGTHPFLDFPDLAYGSNYLYLTADAGQNGSVSQTFIARIGLSNLAGALNLASGPRAWRYIDGGLFFGKVVQNTGSRAFWASNTSTSTMGVSYWDESSTSWFGPASVGIFRWPNGDYSTLDASGQPWLNTYTGVVLGSVRINNTLYFAWTAGRGTGDLSWLSQPNVQLVAISTSGFSLISQRAIWNPSNVYAYPNLATSFGHLGISMAWGGGGNFFVNHAVGDLTTDPFLVTNTATSNANCGCGRWGDYFAIRPQPSAQTPTFVSSSYAFVVPPTGGSGHYDVHYVQFTGS